MDYTTDDNIHSHNFLSGDLTVTWVLLTPDLFEAVFLFKSFILLALWLIFCDSFPGCLEVKCFKIINEDWYVKESPLRSTEQYY